MELADFKAQDSIILLRPLIPEDQPYYHRIRLQHSMIYRIACDSSDDNGLSFFRKDVLRENVFFCAVIAQKGDAFIGYLGVHDLEKPVWEIAIELDKEYCHQGYGSRALPLFLNELYQATGHAEYRARVDADNVASQGCFEKIGASLAGICNEIILSSNYEKERMEKEFSHLIDDQIIALAARLGVEPQKLLSHVLEYRLTCPI